MKIILVILILFIGINTAFADKYIPWSEEQKLTGNDFQGDIGKYPETYQRQDKNDFAFTWGYPKLINYNFTRVNSSICQVQITNINAIGMFDTEASWIKEEYKNDLKVLNHEQVYFDIIEIYAHRIETDLLFQIIECPHGFYDESQIHNEIRLMASNIGDMHQKMHDIYDFELKNGISTQDSWNKKIEKLLIQDKFVPIFHKELPPLVQLKNGISQKDITCTKGWILLKNSNDKSICTTPAVAKILEKRNWSIEKIENNLNKI